MKALTFEGPRTIRCSQVPEPRIVDSTDAIVRVELSAICGSDLHVYHEREKGIDPGTVMGHELVGEVVELGHGVTRLRKGDRVVSPFTTSCGECFYCVRALTCRCPRGQLLGWVEKGVGLPGAQAERVRVPLADSTLVPIPEGIPLEEALLLADILPTAFFCADLAEVSRRGVYAVIGCGPVGLLTILAARECGAADIYAVDSVPERLDRARVFGATPINFIEVDPAAVLRDKTEGRGADAVLEAVGSPSAGRLAFEAVRPGGIVATVGVHNEAGFAFSPVEAYGKNLTYRTGRCPARHYIDRLIPVLQRRKHDFASIVSHRLPLEEGTRGYQMFDQKESACIKVLLAP